MTNQEYMLNLRPDDCYDVMSWLICDYGERYEDVRFAVCSWLAQEAIVGEWQHEHGVVTAGGDPAYKCPRCKHGYHVYGIEHRRDQQVICHDCGCFNIYPMR